MHTKGPSDTCKNVKLKVWRKQNMKCLYKGSRLIGGGHSGLCSVHFGPAKLPIANRSASVNRTVTSQTDPGSQSGLAGPECCRLFSSDDLATALQYYQYPFLKKKRRNGLDEAI